MAIGVGDAAPDFSLPGTGGGQGGRTVSLADLRGHPVVLVFYPGDLTVSGTVRRGVFSPVEWRGIDGAPAGTALDEVGLGVE